MYRPASQRVWVLYATVAGTVTVGMDYVAKSGELKFGPGLKVRAEQIAIMDDAIDEGEETFRFRLPNAGLARTGRGPAVGTIQNDDPLQQAWLSRFRRTVGNHVTSGVVRFLLRFSRCRFGCVFPWWTLRGWWHAFGYGEPQQTPTENETDQEHKRFQRGFLFLKTEVGMSFSCNGPGGSLQLSHAVSPVLNPPLMKTGDRVVLLAA